MRKKKLKGRTQRATPKDKGQTQGLGEGWAGKSGLSTREQKTREEADKRKPSNSKQMI